MTDYTLVYPTPDVDLTALTRAALATVGSAYVTVVSGPGSQALRVPADSAGRIYEAAGLAPDGSQLSAPPEGEGDEDAPPPAQTRKSASGPEEESPGPDASTATATASGRTAGRAGGRTAKKTAAKKATSQRASASTKEGDDQ